jgi:hypothetical protein
MTDESEVQPPSMGVAPSQSAVEFLYSQASIDEQGMAWVHHLRDTVTDQGVTLPPDAVEELTDILGRLSRMAAPLPYFGPY